VETGFDSGISRSDESFAASYVATVWRAFPMSGASSWVRAIMMINPMTYAMSALRQVLYLGAANPIPEVCSLMAAVCVSILFALE
jgi:ABC-type polysaccharide/polyol phosphate export permease